VWKYYTDAEGKPFENIVDWLHYTFPNGTSMGQGQHALTYEEAIKLTEGASDVHAVLLNNAPRRGRGGDQKSASAKNQKMSTFFDLYPKCSSASKITLAIRLSKEQPKVFADFQKGKYKTITEAATAAGMRKNDGNLRRAKSAFRKMTANERAEFLEWMKSSEAERHK
jgi:hypothetical protein